MLLELFVFLLDFVYGYTDHVDHVAENGSSYDLDDGDHNGLGVVLGDEVAIADSDHGCVGPVKGIDVENVPWSAYQIGFLYPSVFALGAKVDHTVHDECLNKRIVTNICAITSVKQNSSIILSYFRFLLCYA